MGRVRPTPDRARPSLGPVWPDLGRVPQKPTCQFPRTSRPTSAEILQESQHGLDGCRLKRGFRRLMGRRACDSCMFHATQRGSCAAAVASALPSCRHCCSTCARATRLDRLSSGKCGPASSKVGPASAESVPFGLRIALLRPRSVGYGNSVGAELAESLGRCMVGGVGPECWPTMGTFHSEPIRSDRLARAARFGLVSGSIWARFRLGSIWGRFGGIWGPSGSPQCPCVVRFETIWERVGLDLGSIWGSFGVDLASFWVDRVDPGSIWVHLESTWGPLGGSIVDALGSARGQSEVNPGPIWGQSGVHPRSILGRSGVDSLGSIWGPSLLDLCSIRNDLDRCAVDPVRFELDLLSTRSHLGPIRGLCGAHHSIQTRTSGSPVDAPPLARPPARSPRAPRSTAPMAHQ